MPVNTPHPDYAAQKASWRKQRIFKEGSEAVKAAGEDFLPRLSGSDDLDYRTYKDRALFYEATGRTCSALCGSVFRKGPIIEFPDPTLLEHIGKHGESVEELIKRTTDEQLVPGRVGTLIDSPAKAASVDGNPAPFVALYFAENIINWQVETVGEKEELVEVVLCEEFESRKQEDRFTVEKKKQYRVLRLGNPVQLSEEQPITLSSEETSKRIYYQEVWVEQTEEQAAAQSGAQKQYVLKEVIVPRMWGGRVMEHIPFVFHNSRNLSAKPEPGVMGGLVAVNHSHYLSSADLEHGRHFTALPTPVLAGFNPEFRLRIGSGVAWVSENPAARAYFLEFSGSGLGHLVTGQQHKEGLMATLGARLLEGQKAGVEAADAMRLRQAGEQSALTNIVVTGSQGWTKTLQFVAEWRGLAGDVSVEINKDFDISLISPTEQQALMLQVQSGFMSYDTYFYNMKKGEVYPEGWTVEDEKAAIEKGLPVAPATATEEDGEEGDPFAPDAEEPEEGEEEGEEEEPEESEEEEPDEEEEEEEDAEATEKPKRDKKKLKAKFKKKKE